MALHHLDAGEKAQIASLTSPNEPRTSALVRTDRFEAVQLVLHARDEIHDHAVAGYTTLLCLEGAVALKCPGAVELRGGDWLYLDRWQPRSITAIEDSSLLMTILFD